MSQPHHLESDHAYEALPSLPEGDLEQGSPDLLSSESYEWDAPANLDDFFTRIYRYHEEKGFLVICCSRILNLLALGFTVLFSAFLLLFVKWSGFRSECIHENTCDISEVALEWHPWKEGFTFWNVSCAIYLLIFGAYWTYNLGHLFIDLRAAAYIRYFTTHKLGLSERQLQTVTWPDIVTRIVQAQTTTRMCISRDLTEHDIVSRIMRKENYLIGMLNKGVLALHFSLPCMRPRFMLTKTLEWNLQWCILNTMFDDAFQIRSDFVHQPRALEKRFRRMALVNLLLAPFLFVFLLIYFFLRNAERFYHSPSALGARRWSPLAAWRLREFNELPYYVHHRLNASHKAAEKYVAQFPSPLLSSIAKFVAFIAGSFAALLLFVTLTHDDILERPLFDRNVVWWIATLGIVLAVSRGLIVETGVAFEPELAMLETVAHTHYLPRHWRGRAHTREVQTQFQQLFQYKALLFVEEMASILLTPFILYFSLPKCAPAVVAFVKDFTVRVDGLGDVCSLAAFDLNKHGNSKYGSPHQAQKDQRSRQGKLEKSLVSFMATYPSWQPSAAAKHFLNDLGAANNQPSHAGPHFPFTAHMDQFANGLGMHSHAGTTGRHQAGPIGADSMFASAEFPNWGTTSILTQDLKTVSDAEWKVASSQGMLQSFYSEREQRARQQPVPPSPDRTTGRPAVPLMSFVHQDSTNARRSMLSSPHSRANGSRQLLGGQPQQKLGPEPSNRAVVPEIMIPDTDSQHASNSHLGTADLSDTLDDGLLSARDPLGSHNLSDRSLWRSRTNS